MVDGDITEAIILPAEEVEVEQQKKRLNGSYSNGKITFAPTSLKQYQRTYGIVGNHSDVQICHWNKKSVKGHRGCYKVKFYGIDCHGCAQRLGKKYS